MPDARRRKRHRARLHARSAKTESKIEGCSEHAWRLPRGRHQQTAVITEEGETHGPGSYPETWRESLRCPTVGETVRCSPDLADTSSPGRVDRPRVHTRSPHP